MLLFSHRRRAGQSTLPGGAQPPTTFQQTPPKRNFTQRRHFCPRGCWWGTPGASSCRSSPGLSSALGSVRFGVGLDALKGLSQPKCLRDSTIVSRPNQRKLARTTACPAPGSTGPSTGRTSLRLSLLCLSGQPLCFCRSRQRRAVLARSHAVRCSQEQPPLPVASPLLASLRPPAPPPPLAPPAPQGAVRMPASSSPFQQLFGSSRCTARRRRCCSGCWV